MDRHLKAYLRDLRKEHRTREATEHSYRPALKKLIEAIGPEGVQAVNEPTQGEYGAPDFIVHQNGVPVGHVECKDIGANLDEVEQSAQLRRYRDALPNLILTDYVEFRWYVNGEQCSAGILARSDDEKLRSIKNEHFIGSLWKSFFATNAIPVRDAADLAQRMAAKAQLLRDGIARVLAADELDTPGELRNLLLSYREVLISALGEEEFSDMQAQTAAYGLFAARCLHTGKPSTFTRQTAIFEETTPFLQSVLTRIAGPEADERISWIVDDLALLLARADMDRILRDFGRRTQHEDPVVHFYEDFLAAYDPRLRDRRGVYYTPEPVVSYIVRSVDCLLRRDFDLPKGLADKATVTTQDDKGKSRSSPRVLILDPAVGTGTFLREVVIQIRDEINRQKRGGSWSDYVKQHLLPRLFGFELLLAPYAIAHLKLALEIGGGRRRFSLPKGQRVNVFLTNSLEPGREAVGRTFFGGEIAREAEQANAVKREQPVMVIVGNPPYEGHSQNQGDWINDLMHGQVDDSPADYFSVDGAPLGEQNPKWVNNDYVKFIRFAQWRIERTGEGVLAFVTSNSYLDSPTFRGVRRSLMNSFSEIYLLDLHGNSKKRERAPSGEQDENVFDITEGVAIGVFVRRSGAGDQAARIFHADLWGRRETEDGDGKYRWLSEHDLGDTEWTELHPRQPQYLFIPRDDRLAAEYEAGWKLTNAFPINALGFQTHRDQFAIAHAKEEMEKRLSDMCAAEIGDDTMRSRYRLSDNRDWKLTDARAALQSKGTGVADSIIQCGYRAFDKRWCFFGTEFIDYPRSELMKHVAGRENVCLNIARQTKAVNWAHALASDAPASAVYLEVKDGSSVLPLYIYSSDDDSLPINAPERAPNLAAGLIAEMKKAVGLEFVEDGRGDLEATFGPEDVFHYIYAVLHSPEYRRRYADFLRSDFPRVPLPDRREGRWTARRRCELFAELVKLGERLAALHLLEVEGKEQPAFDVAGANSVGKIRYVEPSTAEEPGRVYINATQHFEGVAPETWAFTIGGYQPAQKWLKDRKGRTLSFDEIEHYQRICAALAETPTLMNGIDAVIKAHGGWPLSEAGE